MRILRNLLFISFAAFSALLILDYETKKPASLSTTTEPLKLYLTDAGDPIRETIIESINNAKKSIVVMIYSFSENKIIQALNDAASKGIKVKVIYDSKASNNVWSKLSSKIEKVPFLSKGLMHLKVIVIDGETVWYGSTNLTKDALTTQENLMSHILSSDVATSALLKASNISTIGKKHPVATKEFIVGDQKIDLIWLPDDKKGAEKILKLIDSAQKTIKVAMYTFTRKDFAEHLFNAKQKGVDVEVILDKSSSEGASHEVYNYLIKRGIKVTLGKKEHLMHHKLMIVDDKILVHGSTNWTKQAFLQNHDSFMIVYGLREDQNKKLETLWRGFETK